MPLETRGSHTKREGALRLSGIARRGLAAGSAASLLWLEHGE